VTEVEKDKLTMAGTGLIAVNTAAIALTLEDIGNLQVDFDRQKIVSDYFFTNDDAILVPDATEVCHTEVICLPNGQTIDF